MKPSIIYAGDANQERTNVDIISWLNIDLLQKKVSS